MRAPVASRAICSSSSSARPSWTAALFDASLRWQPARDWQAGVRGEWLLDFGWLPSLRLQWQPAGGFAWGLSWHVHEQRLGLQASSTHWVVRFGADRLGSDATARGWATLALESRLLAGRIELASGHGETGRARLLGVAREATARGLTLLTRRASAPQQPR